MSAVDINNLLTKLNDVLSDESTPTWAVAVKRVFSKLNYGSARKYRTG